MVHVSAVFVEYDIVTLISVHLFCPKTNFSEEHVTILSEAYRQQHTLFAVVFGLSVVPEPVSYRNIFHSLYLNEITNFQLVLA